MVEALKYLTKEIPEFHLEIIEETDCSLTVLFYGCRLIFRIEKPWSETSIDEEGQLHAYRVIGDTKPEEKRIAVDSYFLDPQGNILTNIRNSPDLEPTAVEYFSRRFVRRVFTSLAKEKVNLRL